jgi:RND family efflux transporter MFP subunit
LLPLLLAGCNDERAAGHVTVRPVKTAVVERIGTGRTLTYSGVVRPRIESPIGFRVSGKIVERLVNIGDRLEVGQVIARLDDTDLKLAETSARAAVAAAATRRNVAADNLDRAARLLPQSFISKAAYDTRRNELDAAAGALESAEAQLHQATNAAGYALLKADKSGIVTAVSAEPGQVVSAGQPVITLADDAEIEIAIAVPEQDAGHLAVGQAAKATLWAGPSVSSEGWIREIAGQADPASRTYAVRISVPAPPQGMRLGMTATVALRIEETVSPVAVPVAALAERDGNTVVFVVDKEGDNKQAAVRRTPVSIGGVADEVVRVSGGLQPGDVVVTGGVQFLRDGMRVRLPGAHGSRSAKSG